MTKYPSAAIANAFLEYAERDGRPLSHLKLQKLVYFADGVAAGALDHGIAQDRPEAWRYGPVYPRLYQQFKNFGSDLIPPSTRAKYLALDENGAWQESDFPPPSNPDVKTIIDNVWGALKDTSAIDLSAISHDKQGPWSAAWNDQGQGAIIDDASLRNYFSKWVAGTADAAV
jgi:uncharacterized phage-associated protein